MIAARIFLSTPSARRATARLPGRPPLDQISIHALREEGDDQIPLEQWYQTNFYPRPPRGGRHYGIEAKRPFVGFLSTPSARRATEDLVEAGRISQISIHALREEGDTESFSGALANLYFYPRPPRGGRPVAEGHQIVDRVISIHALREEGDAIKAAYPDAFVRFLSTPSARRATNCNNFAVASSKISIHALREEGDQHHIGVTVPRMDFYPRPPRGGRPLLVGIPPTVRIISIHALREEGDISMP